MASDRWLTPSTTHLEALFMGEALAAARAVAGRTGNNPPVGCVIVKDGCIVARGATQPPATRISAPKNPTITGGAHAEVMAVRASQARGASVAGADVYVTLEPCAFTGRTPPCSTLLVSLRPRRVLVGIRDPHPNVLGAGIAELRAAGITVVEGVLEESVRTLLAGWVKRYGTAVSP